MFTSQSLRAVAKPGSLGFREHRLDDVVHQIDVQGTLDEHAESWAAASTPRSTAASAG